MAYITSQDEYFVALGNIHQQQQLSAMEMEMEMARLQRAQQMAAGTYGYLGDTLLGTNNANTWTTGTLGSAISMDSIIPSVYSGTFPTPIAKKPKPLTPLTFLQQLRKEIDEWIKN